MTLFHEIVKNVFIALLLSGVINMNKRILAAVMCSAMTVSAFASCGTQKSVSVSTSRNMKSGSSTDGDLSVVDTEEESTSSSKSGSLTDGDLSVVDTEDESTPSSGTETSSAEIANFNAPQKGDKVIVMNIKDYGEVKIRLFPEYAEKGVENFTGLADQGYYDGLIFHRVIKDFMIQGGDPLGTGMGGESIWGEKFDGGTDPHLSHLAGAVAYANSGSTSTDGSQFYIVTGTKYDKDTIDQMNTYYGLGLSDEAVKLYTEVGGAPWLDGGYTIFGQVYDGLDIVFKIQDVATDSGNDKPMKDVVIESVKVAEYDGEELKYYLSDYE